MWGQAGFFDIDDRLRRLSDLGDQLEAFRVVLDFEIFRPELDAALAYSDGARGGRPPFDPVMMFKILVIQATNNLSDERAEFLINDRLSFMRFLGLGLSDRIPDARTIWLFREKLTNAGAIGPLFERFDATLRQSGYIAMSGQIVDASLIAAPRQRNSEDEKKAIKEGRIPDDWKDKPAKLRQKDRDARWTVKFTKAKPREDGSLPTVDLAIPVFGYQNHISIDCGFGFNRSAISDAHDVVAQERPFVLRSLQKNEKSIPCVDHAQRSEILAHDRDVQKLPFFHDRPHILQQVTWTAVDDILGHHRRHGDGATTALAKTHLANNICSGDNTHHCAVLVADNDKIDVSAIEKPGNLRQQSVVPDRNKTFPCHRHYFLH